MCLVHTRAYLGCSAAERDWRSVSLGLSLSRLRVLHALLAAKTLQDYVL